MNHTTPSSGAPEPGPLPPYLYGRECSANERVWSAEAMHAYRLQELAPLLAEIAELRATLTLQQASYEREIVLEVAAERERCKDLVRRYMPAGWSAVYDAMADAPTPTERAP